MKKASAATRRSARRPSDDAPAPAEAAKGDGERATSKAAALKHEIGGPDTCWIFACASQEARHLDDIVYCIDVLRRRGVADRAIFVFTDHTAAESHLGPYGISNVHPLQELGAVMCTQSFRYVMAVCGGHGSQRGLSSGASSPILITPHDLFSAVSAVQDAEVAVTFLCQCYAGVFHFTDATTRKPNHVVIGSSSFYPTLSALIQLTSPLQTASGAAGLTGWQANLYQVSLFEWLSRPKDIDGDGEVTLVDAYKFAGVSTIARVQNVRVDQFALLRSLQDQHAEAMKRREQPVVLDAYRAATEQAVSILYNIQEPWLLNARLAAKIGFV